MNYIILIIVAGVSFVVGRRSVGVKTITQKSAKELDVMRVDAKDALHLRTENRKKRFWN